MDSLKEIVKIISKKRLDKIDLIDDNMISGEDTLFSRFYLAIKNELISNDEDAVKYLYGELSPLNQQSYRSLKSRLRSRIFNTLYFLDLNQSNIGSNFQKILFEQNKCVQTINILRRNGATHSSISIIKNNFQTAVNYHLYDIAKFYAFELAKYYAMSGKQKLFQHYRELHEEYSQKDRAIQNATLSYYQIQFYIHHSNEKKSDTDKGELLKQLIAELKEYRDQAYSYDTEYFYLRSKLFLYEDTGYLEDILDTCRQITELSSQKQFQQPIWKGVAALYRAKALLSVSRYEDGLTELKKDISLFNEGGLNWFTAKEYLLKLSMHHLNTEYSEVLFQEIVKNKSYKTMPEHYKQKMFIYKAYISLMKDELVLNENKRLKLAKLFNDTLYYVNDKSGFFLSIRFLDIIESLRSGQFDAFYDKCIAVKRYMQRNLLQNNTQREQWFIGMLTSIETLKFQKKQIQQKNASVHERLKSNQDEILINDYEILPYHFLWEIILRYL